MYRIYDLKYYEEVEYPELMRLYEIKQKILEILLETEKKDMQDPNSTHVVVFRSYKKSISIKNPRNSTILNRYGIIPSIRYFGRGGLEGDDISNIPGYPKLFIFNEDEGNKDLLHPYMYDELQHIMSIEDPNIKLRELRRLV